MNCLEFTEGIISHILSWPVIIGIFFIRGKEHVKKILNSITKVIETKLELGAEAYINSFSKALSSSTETDKENKIEEEIKETNPSNKQQKPIDIKKESSEIKEKSIKLYDYIKKYFNSYLSNLRLEQSISYKTSNERYISDGLVLKNGSDTIPMFFIEFSILRTGSTLPLKFHLRRRIERIRYYKLPIPTLIILLDEEFNNKDIEYIKDFNKENDDINIVYINNKDLNEESYSEEFKLLLKSLTIKTGIKKISGA